MFAAVVAVAAQRLVAVAPDRGRDLDRAREDIGQDLLGYARRAAAREDCDSDVIQALVTAECVQRPRWVRRLERVKGRVVAGGSYGVAQVYAASPISDEASIDELCHRFHGYYPPRSQGSVRTALLEARIEAHNNDAELVSMVLAEYTRLAPYPEASSERADRDGRPEVEIIDSARAGAVWRLSGTTTLGSGGLVLRALTQGQWTEHAGSAESGPRRQRWQADVPLTAEAVEVNARHGNGAGPSNEDDPVRLDLTYG